MRWTTERKLAIALSLALAPLIVDAILSYKAIRMLLQNEQMVLQTQQVFTELEAILSNMEDAETGQRGFVITGNENYLEPYNTALARIDGEVKRLKALTADNATQQRRITLLESSIADKLKELSETIALRSQEGFESAQQKVLSGRGKKEMDEIRQIIAEMEDEENRLLKLRNEESKASARTAILTSSITSLIAVASLASLYYLAIRGLAERRRSEKIISDQREWLHVTLSSIGDAVIATDTDGSVTFMNSVAESLTRWNQQEAIGKPLEEVFKIINAKTGKPAENPVKRVLKESTVVGLANHTVLVAKDGTKIPIDDSAAPIKNEGTTIGVVLVFRDVTERQRAEEERARLLDLEQAARAEAESANRAKDEFLAIVSHELRTPLNAILGWTRLLGGGKLDTDAASKAIETIERSAKAQALLIEDLLDMSRIITGKLRLNFEPVNLVQIIDKTVEIVRPTAQAKSIQLKAELDSAASAVMGDAARLQQVIWNLLSNAVKFTPKDGRVEIRLERNDSQAQITVSDTGRGISPEFLPHVFERFQQADIKDARQHGGLGLGLAIVHHIVEMHGGTVKADSPGDGQGATFTVRLPRRALQANKNRLIEEEAAESRSLLGSLPTLNGVKVLVVDDEASAREIITEILNHFGATVTAVASTADAIMALAQIQPDVLVSDIGMPDENGFELISKVRRLKPEHGGDIPAVALTAYASTEDRMRALTAGFQNHVPKPVEPAELVVVVASLAKPNKMV